MIDWAAFASVILFFSWVSSREIEAWRLQKVCWVRWVAREVTDGDFVSALASQRYVDLATFWLRVLLLISAPYLAVRGIARLGKWWSK